MAAAAAVPEATPARVVWVHSSGFDTLFLANVLWPLLLLPGVTQGRETVADFWQVYFLTLPHRWVTLVLVALDPDRRGDRGWLLGGIALAVLLLVSGVWLGTDGFTCLALVDYCWNAWHFAAQHSGVLRMYSRKLGTGPRHGWVERHGLRFFVTYAILRTASWSTGWLDQESWVRSLDLAVLLVPAVLFISVLAQCGREGVGKLAYTASVCSLYSLLLLSLSNQWGGMIVALTTASGLFHAVEYLGVVSHYAQRRRSVGSKAPFCSLARHWAWFLATYMASLGALGVWLDRPYGQFHMVWQGMNLWAALVHYSFDGMIWKLRRPATSQALGLGGGA